ncbi:hypothetical protein GCM10017781_42210 [Deinococcus metalli]|uniref:Uncharacterized protein n=2 Tax=Deinococcus metalli TaxID=1141878 RepID=A0ABQ3JUY5_9DEIO|nr:hypothetical protein GCM10017781_42210 [Deinococcus metalli]
MPLTGSRHCAAGLDQLLTLALQRELTLYGMAIPSTDPAISMRLAPERGTPESQPGAASAQLHDFATCCAATGVPFSTLDASGEGLASTALDVDAVWLTDDVWAGPLNTPNGLWPGRWPSHVPLWITHPQAVPAHLTVAWDGRPQAAGLLAAAARLSRAWTVPLRLLVVARHDDIYLGVDTLDTAAERLMALGVTPATAMLQRGERTTLLVAATAPDSMLITGWRFPTPGSAPRHTDVTERFFTQRRGAALLYPTPLSAGRW